MLSEKASIDIVKTVLCSTIDYGNMFVRTCNTHLTYLVCRYYQTMH